MSALAPEQAAYLREHRWAVLITTRDDGSPQASMVAYHFDGDDIVVSCRRRAAKYVNARKRPRVVVTVTDDNRYLSVHGVAECLDTGPARDALTERLRASLLPEHATALGADIDAGLDRVGRVVLRVRPDRAVGRV